MSFKQTLISDKSYFVCGHAGRYQNLQYSQPQPVLQPRQRPVNQSGHKFSASLMNL